MITFYFFFDFLVDMVDKGEKCPKYQAFPRQPAVNQSVNQTVNRRLFRMAVPFAGLLLLLVMRRKTDEEEGPQADGTR